MFIRLRALWQQRWPSFHAWCLHPSRKWPTVLLLAVVWAVAILTVVRTASKLGAGSVTEIIEAIKVIVWPFVALVGLILLRVPISSFLTGIAQRVTKLSAFQIELELSAVTATEAKAAAMSELKRGQAMTVGDSASQIFTQLADQTAADFSVIDLGSGDEWITSRIFLVGALFERMRGVRCIVFTEGRGENAGDFVGTIDPQSLRWRLALRFPELELAFSKALLQSVPTEPIDVYPGMQMLRNERGALELYVAQNLARQFILSLQSSTPPPHGHSERIHETPDLWERSELVTGHSIRQLLGTGLNQGGVKDLARIENSEAVRLVLARTGNFVAGLSGDKFVELIDRAALLEELGRKAATVN